MKLNKAAILDWGIGGIGVLQELLSVDPYLSFVYLSDSGYTPYGKVSAGELRARVLERFEFARKHYGAEYGIIACNAASTVFVGDECPLRGFPIYNVIDPATEEIKNLGFRRIGVIGGQRTVDSRVYSRALKPHGIEVIERVAQPLSALIEQGIITGSELEETLIEILNPFRVDLDRRIEALVLGCTHYPAVAPVISALLPGVELIDPARILAKKRCFGLRASLRSPVGWRDFLTSGSHAAMVTAAKRAFGFDVERTVAVR